MLLALCCTSALAQQYTISTIAGGAPPPTPAAATGTSIGQPHNVTVDSAGNVYFSAGNNVFKMSATGTLSVFAGNSRAGYSGDGGPALNAQLNHPAGIALDSAGNVYISDSMNNVVRIVTPNGNINTFAGNGTAGYSGDTGAAAGSSAELNNPLGLAVDKNGNLYIADNFNHAVRIVTTDGNINTFAGNFVDSFGYVGDGGAANLAQLTFPTDVAVDSSGNVYIADYGNFVIRQVTTDGIIHTYAGTNANGFSGDGGPATSSSSTNPAELYEPYGVAVDSSGNLYISEYGDSRIRKVASGSNGAGGNISTIAGNGTSGFSGDGSKATSAEMNIPRGICVDSSGNIYVADWDNNRIRQITSGGTINTVAGNGILSYSGDGGAANKAQLNSPSAVAVDASGNIYVVDTGNNVVRQVTAKGVISTFAGNGTAGFSGDGGAANKAQLNAPQGVAVDGSGNVYIADAGNFRVRVVANGNISTFAGAGSPGYTGDGAAATAAKFYLPGAVASDKAGNVYIADFEGCVVRKVPASGIITTVAGNGGCGYGGDGGPATSALLNNPSAIGLDPSGNLYIAELGDNRVRMVSTSGTITTIAGDGSDGYTAENAPALASHLPAPNGVTADASGNVYISMAGNRVMQVAGGGILVTLAGTGTPGYTGDGGPANAALLNMPSGIAMDSAGNFYIADSANNAVRMLVFAGYGNSVSTITNGASGAKGAVSPGEIVVVYGSGLGPQQLTNEQVSSNNVVTTVLAGTRVLFNGTPAPILYTWATQVSAVVPFGITGSTAQLQVQYGNQTSPSISVPVVPTAPALFTADSSGQGQALANNADGTNNSATNPATAGSVIALYATGVGPLSPAVPDGTVLFPPLPNTALPVSVIIGGQPAIAHSATGVADTVAGSVQIYVEVPAGVSGSAVPVVIQAGGVSSPAGVTIAVAGS